jgi:hypothetical protein
MPTYKEYLVQENKSWQDIIIPALLKVSPGPFIALDIGCSGAVSLQALFSAKALAKGYGIEPNWVKVQSKMQAAGIEVPNWAQQNITILPIDGLDPQVPYAQANLIIKTFNNWILWEDILKLTTPEFLITSAIQLVTDSRYEIVVTIDKKIANKYLIYRLK